MCIVSQSNINDNVYCIEKTTGQRYWVNAKAPQKVSNEYLDGVIVILMDDGQHSYFDGKKRRFDVQLQFQLKQQLTTEKSLWYAIELDESLELGMMENMLANAVLGFCQGLNQGSFHSRLAEEPCMSFKVAHSMERVAQTQPGDFPPCLGDDIEETLESIEERVRDGMDWNLRDTYTISCFSSYFDFLSWSCMNLPGLPTFDLTQVVGDQPFRFTLYTLKDEDGEHVADNKNYILNLEISIPSKTRLGPAALDWIEKNETESETSQEDTDEPTPQGNNST